jgi:hypothetical protein
VNENAKAVIDSLIKARTHIREQIANQGFGPDKAAEIDAVWEGYLTIVHAVYSEQNYQVVMPLDPEVKP